jgi:hypothetical protein
VLLPRAIEEILQLPCLWLRGLVPAAMSTVNTPCPVEEDLVYVGCSPAAAWPVGVYYTDGSGGKYSSVPQLRRCGVGVACVEDEPLRFSWGCHSPLPGDRQTVPRAELFAIILIAKNAAPGDVTVYSDSLLSVNLYNGGQAGCLKSDNVDLWQDLWS